ncbi:hypothetical protein FOVSG1_015088 [Fusarium oxysporum f. sp. vasinfectum]
MSWKSPSPGRAERVGRAGSSTIDFFLLRLILLTGQPEFFAAAATSSVAEHSASPTGHLRAVKQLVQIRHPTDLNGPSDDACTIALCHAPESRRFEN